MRLNNKELKRILQEAAEYDADCIMEEVESAPEMQDVVAPDDMYDNVIQMIREHESKKKTPSSHLSNEQQELIRLGLKYRKNSGKGKYLILVAAIVCALAVGTISLGDNEKVVQKVKDLVDGKEQVLVDGEGITKDVKTASEDDAYEIIDETFGFYPIKLLYLPRDMKFSEVVIEEATQIARLYYVNENKDNTSILYSIITGNRTGTAGIYVEDKLIKEYEREINDVLVTVEEYLIEENNMKRWMVNFVHGNAQYTMVLTNIEEAEIEKIIDNLYFS